MTNSSVRPVFHEDLAHWLAAIDDEKLGTLLVNRPDVLHPIPPGTTSLAVRLQLLGSIRPAFGKLSIFDFAVIEAAATLGGTLNPLSAPEIVEFLDARARSTDLDPTGMKELVAESILKLTDFALAYGDEKAFMLADGVKQQFDHVPFRLPDSNSLSAEEISAALTQVDERQSKILETLQLSGGTGISKDAAVDADPSRPIPQLIALGLLDRVSESTVAIPRAVRRVLNGLPAAQESFLPPQSEQDPTEEETANGAATALETVRLVRDVVEFLGENPVALLRDGAVGVRNLSAATKELRLDKEELYPLISLALAGKLLGTGVPKPRPDADELKNFLAPTAMMDEFVELSLADQWAYLAASWVEHSTSKPWIIGLPGRMDSGKARAVRLLDREMFDASIITVRQVLLGILAEATSPLSPQQLKAKAHFERPLIIAHRTQDDITGVIDEAIALGVIASTPAGLQGTDVVRALLSADAPAANAAEEAEEAATPEGQDLQGFAAFQRLRHVVKEHTPAATEQFIVQADMTVLVPGPMPRPLQVELNLVADLESAGMASVYRVSEQSLSRGFEAGRTAQEITDFFAQHALGEVPQTLSYLVADLARQHGSMRAGQALSYVRCEDEAQLAAAVANPLMEFAGLRLIAPTVAVAQVPLGQLMEGLKQAGLRPAAEDAQGVSIDIRPEPARVRYTPMGHKRTTADTDRIATAVQKIRELGAPVSTKGEVYRDNFQTHLHHAIQRAKEVTLTVFDGSEEETVMVSPIDVRMGRLSAVNAVTADPVTVSLKDIREIKFG